ncbi:pyridoxal phosphate-dependent transferase, partial [Blastocladiella britannica]
MAANHKLCMIPGPVEFHDDVLTAMSTPATSHVDPAFINQFGESIEMLRTTFFSQKGQPFIISGSGTLGWDVVAANLVEPGENALVINTGLFGDRFGECLETYGAKVTHVHAASIGLAPTMAAVASALKERSYKVVTITHVDTSTGVLNDIRTISHLVHELSPSTLVVVDAVCSAGGEEINMDRDGIDVMLTASQKALGTPPGLAILVVSEKAMHVFRNRKSPPTSYFASMVKWTPIMQAYEARKPSYFATPAVQLVMALHTSLKQIVARPLEERFAQHVAISDHVKKTITGWGLKLVPQSHELAAHTLTAV